MTVKLIRSTYTVWNFFSSRWSDYSCKKYGAAEEVQCWLCL